MPDSVAINEKTVKAQPAPGYRARLKGKAKELMQLQAEGKFLNNQQKRIIKRYQKQEAAKRSNLKAS